MTLTEALRILSKQEIFENIIGTVTDYDSTTKTCQVQPVDDRALLIDVRVSAIENPSSGIIPIPTIGSIVIVSQTPTGQQWIAMMSEIDSYQIVTDKFQFNSGDNGGLININDLVTKINNLENKVNDVITSLKTHTHIGVQTGSGTSGTSADFTTINNLTNTNVSDIEDSSVVH